MADPSTTVKPGCVHEGYVAACIQAERATLPESRAMWETVANMLRGVAALLVLGACYLLVRELAVESSPALLISLGIPVYYVKLHLYSLGLVVAALFLTFAAVILSRRAR